MLNLESLKQFKENQYARHLVFKSDRVEILLVCWRPGQGTPIHDHGESDGLMFILEGEITNTTYQADGRKVSTVWRKGDMGHTPVGARHEVKNTSNEDVVSLHIYAPPLDIDRQKQDLGYHNTVVSQDIFVSDEVMRYYLGSAQPCIPYQLLDPGL